MRDVVKTANYRPSPNLKVVRWHDKRIIFRGRSYPVKNLLLLGFVFLLIIFLPVYFYIRHQNSQLDPNQAIQKETKELTGHIGNFMDLPTDEQPTLATVTDREKLQDQDFFANAQNGDKLLVYQKAKKAILYRPSTGKIIEVSRLTSGEETQTNPPAAPDQTDEISN